MSRRLGQGAAGGDFNLIIHLQDSVNSPQNKISPSCRKLVKAFSWIDSYRVTNPRTKQFSRYQSVDGDGATRIDRSYHWGDLEVSEAEYHSISFSDHLSLRVSYSLPDNLNRYIAPQSKPAYKIPPTVVTEETFQQRLHTSMIKWLRVKDSGANIIMWWQYMVKGGIIFLAKQRGKELKKEQMGRLNMLKLKQAYLTS